MARVIASSPTQVYAASEGDKFNTDTTLTVVSCYTCGVRYAIPSSLYNSARKHHTKTSNGWWLCCPLGHTWGYTGKSDEEKLREQLEVARDRSGRLASKLEQTQASLRGTKANAARTRKELKSVKARASAGVCPCCNRTFQQLARHMESQHPGFAA